MKKAFPKKQLKLKTKADRGTKEEEASEIVCDYCDKIFVVSSSDTIRYSPPRTKSDISTKLQIQNWSVFGLRVGLGVKIKKCKF